MTAVTSTTPVVDTDERESFRALVRAWMDDHAPAKGGADDFSAVHIVSANSIEEFNEREHHAHTVTRRWQRSLFDAGLAGRSWAVEYGGAGMPVWQDHVVAEEQARYGVSTKMLAIALEMLPPVLFGFGTPELRAAHLPRVIRGDESWCQLLSEPDAGSDLASVTTIASSVAGGWAVTGQKVWTSGAGSSDFALLIARTDRTVPGRAGLSCLALDMSQPGVVVRPLRQMSGSFHFNEVFLDAVFVPETALIGGLGEGWSVLRTMLASERAAIGGGTSARSVAQLMQLARDRGRNHEPKVRQRLAAAYAREHLLDLLQVRIASGAVVPAAGSLTKLLYSDHARLSADDALDILGAAGTVASNPAAGPWLDRLLFAPGLRLGGGTDEIQRNTIAERGLGLPREPTPRR